MIPTEKLIRAGLDEDLAEVLDKMGQADINQVPVLEDGRLLGMVTRANILAFLRQLAGRQGLDARLA
jgi:CBS domain-containing protein